MGCCGADERKDTDSKQPEDTDFKQQRLKAWQPILTPFWVIGSFVVLGILFIAIGVVVYLASQSVVEVKERYDNEAGNPATIIKTLTIPEDMELPVFFYYHLENFYQNHRRYVKSRSDAQLRGDEVTSGSSSLSSCSPLTTDSANMVYYPCGLIANSFFNDKFSACWRPNAVTVNSTCFVEDSDSWRKKGIAWSSDVDKKFKRMSSLAGNSTYDPTYQTKTGANGQALPDVEDEDFIVWMRTAGLPSFKKLYRKIESLPNGATKLSKGDTISITIQNNFAVSQFKGEKWIVLSTTSWLGGKNDFLGLAYIIVGAICIALAAIFGIKQKLSPRKLGDMSYFQWSQQSAAARKASNMRG